MPSRYLSCLATHVTNLGIGKARANPTGCPYRMVFPFPGQGDNHPSFSILPLGTRSIIGKINSHTGIRTRHLPRISKRINHCALRSSLRRSISVALFLLLLTHRSFSFLNTCSIHRYPYDFPVYQGSCPRRVSMRIQQYYCHISWRLIHIQGQFHLRSCESVRTTRFQRWGSFFLVIIS